MRPFNLSVAALLVALLYASGSYATVVTYTNEASWSAAVSGFVNEPFDQGGLQSFTGVVTTNGVIGPARGLLTGSVWQDLQVPNTTSTTFSYNPSNLIGAGATWDTSVNDEGSGLEIILNLVGGGTETVATIGPIDGTFFGFVSTDPFTSFEIIAPSSSSFVETFDMDNLHFATTARVPEPTTLALFGAGFGLIGARAARRRWKKKQD